MKWLFFLLSVGSLAGCYFLVDYARSVGATAIGVYGISAVLVATLIWVFLFFAIGGRKAWSAVVWLLLFLACVFLFWWGAFQAPRFFGADSPDIFVRWEQTKRLLDTLVDKPLIISAIYLGLILGSLGVFTIPTLIAMRVRKIAIREKKKKRVAEIPQSRTRIRGRRGIG